ncbi:hypothetical protein [Sporosalibacterium faouarense]|uniref:hypothetical protein n=1 Tax=Sporosalibacterium faouarense TaxID=516123 RepID=UPI00141C7F05|nr:hypothetical protein [Sporosalibacterium faouarense]MTI48747.1 hypothetical protein [Bacillota bacterium]
MNELEILAKLGDMKEVDYRNTLALASIIEVLVDKGVINRRDIATKAKELDSMSIEDIRLRRMR